MMPEPQNDRKEAGHRLFNPGLAPDSEPLLMLEKAHPGPALMQMAQTRRAFMKLEQHLPGNGDQFFKHKLHCLPQARMYL
jgi:hypothetical protein